MHGPAGILGHGLFPSGWLIIEGKQIVRGTKCTRKNVIIIFVVVLPIQVEDVNRKFDALKEAENRGWVEEHKPPPRQKKAAKVEILL